MDRVRRKVTINFTTSPVLVEEMDRSIEERAYAGRSDYISIALAEKLLNEKLELMDQSTILFLSHFLSDNRSRQQIKELIPENNNFRISALKKKAKACIELGEFDEALECFNEAKKIEASEQKTETRPTISPEEEMTFSEQLKTDTVPKKTTRKTNLK